MDISAGIFLGLGLLALALLLGLHAYRHRGARQAMAQGAQSRGWTFTPGSGALLYRIEGRIEGQPFSAESRRPTGMTGQNRGSAPTVTVIKVDAPLDDGLLILQPALPDGPGGALAGARAGGLFRRILLGDHAETASRLDDMTTLLANQLPDGLLVLASDAALVQRLNDPRAHSALTAFLAAHDRKLPATLIRNPQGVTIRILDSVTAPDHIERAARLARTVARLG